MNDGPDITLAAGPSAKGLLVVYSCRVGLWGCCAAHRRQASSHPDRADLKPCAVPVGAGKPAKQATRWMARASPVFAGPPAPTGTALVPPARRNAGVRTQPSPPSMGLLRSPSQASQLLQGARKPWGSAVARPSETPGRPALNAVIVSPSNRFQKASIGQPPQVPPFAPVHQSQAVHLIGQAQQVLVVGARAVSSLLDVVVEQKPAIDRFEPALRQGYLFAERVHADTRSGLLVMIRRCAAPVLMPGTWPLRNSQVPGWPGMQRITYR